MPTISVDRDIMDSVYSTISHSPLSSMCITATVEPITATESISLMPSLYPFTQVNLAVISALRNTSTPSRDTYSKVQKSNWNAIIKHFGKAKVAAMGSPSDWEWDAKREEWLLTYTFCCATDQNSIETVCHEYLEGVGGKMSVQDLMERWESWWLWNSGKLKTEKSRWKKIWDLVVILTAKSAPWNAARAIYFLSSQYGPDSSHKFSQHAFSNWLNLTNKASVLERAASFSFS
ncbi:hypothetical protein FRB94_002972 [Tulasnella sp. JGI-2019a]|nr:hypothetical protein FRB94_002972 [Tulasnella sp. JGI-2019a]